MRDGLIDFLREALARDCVVMVRYRLRTDFALRDYELFAVDGVGFAARLHRTERFEIVPWPAVLGAIEIRIKEKDNAG